MEVGRLCVKIAGRDAGKKGVVLGIKEKENRVLVDGETRRKWVNPGHLELLNKKIKIKKEAGHEEVKKAFKELGLEVRETKPKEKKEKPRKRKKKEREENKKEDKKSNEGKNSTKKKEKKGAEKK